MECSHELWMMHLLLSSLMPVSVSSGQCPVEDASMWSMAMTSHFFQVTFFAPELFVSLGMAQQTALIATVIIGVANHLAVYVAIWAADEFGRRFLLIEGGIQVRRSPV